MKHLFTISAALLLAFPATLHAADERNQKPNFLIILADDLGFSDLVCYGSDIATLLELAGVKPSLAAGSPSLPGLSLLPSFAKDCSVARDYFFFNFVGNRALRIGDYKLVSAREDHDEWELFNLATDRGEHYNLAAEQPNRARDMAVGWQQFQDRFTGDAGPVLPIDKKSDGK